MNTQYAICMYHPKPSENIGQNRFLNLPDKLPHPYLIGDSNARNNNNNSRIIDF